MATFEPRSRLCAHPGPLLPLGCPWLWQFQAPSRESPRWCIRKVSAPTGRIRATSRSRWRGNWSEWPGEFWAQNSTSEPTGRSRGRCSRKCWTPRGAAEARRVNTLGTHLTVASKGQAWDFGASGAAQGSQSPPDQVGDWCEYGEWDCWAVGCWVGLEKGVVSSEPFQGTGMRQNRGARQASGSVPEGIWVPWAEWGWRKGCSVVPMRHGEATWHWLKSVVGAPLCARLG